MHPSYEDIRALTDKVPDWHDHHGVPRYTPYKPGMSYIYSNASFLVLIKCQGCGVEYKVGYCLSRLNDNTDGIKKDFLEGHFQAGDPPNTGCCSDGATMTSIPIKVLEFWELDYDKSFDWIRDPAYEVKLNVDW